VRNEKKKDKEEYRRRSDHRAYSLLELGERDDDEKDPDTINPSEAQFNVRLRSRGMGADRDWFKTPTANS
jgi:hypothetical protein